MRPTVELAASADIGHPSIRPDRAHASGGPLGAFLPRLPDGTWTTSEAGYVTVWLVSAAMALAVVGLALRLRAGSGGGAPVDRVP